MAVEPGDSSWQSKLDEKSKQKAKEELGEKNDKDREIAVQSFREWVLQQEWLRTPTDFGFLLRFVRARKFSLLLARQTLENYWTCKTNTPEWFHNIDPADNTIQEILKTGVYAVPMKADRNGRRIFFEKQGVLDLNIMKKKWGLDNVFKTIVLVCEWLNRDENVQVNGIHVFLDMTDITLSHSTTFWSPENGKKMMQFYQNSLPCRMKGLHMYNEPPFFDAIYALFKHLMKEKTKERMHLHGRNMSHVYKEIDMSVLPDEYLPDDYEGPRIGSWQQIVDDMIEDMMKPEFRNYIKEISDPKYGVDLSLKPDNDVPVGSFRKLNVD